MNAYNLTSIPEGTIAYRVTADSPRDLPESPKWSGSLPLPAIGDRVEIRDMQKGPGEVVGYFLECGWVGLHVKLDTPKIINGKEWMVVHVFGIDL